MRSSLVFFFPPLVVVAVVDADEDAPPPPCWWCDEDENKWCFESGCFESFELDGTAAAAAAGGAPWGGLYRRERSRYCGFAFKNCSSSSGWTQIDLGGVAGQERIGFRYWNDPVSRISRGDIQTPDAVPRGSFRAIP